MKMNCFYFFTKDYDNKEESLFGRISDCIIEGIYDFGDLLCAPFEWMTGSIGRACQIFCVNDKVS